MKHIRPVSRVPLENLPRQASLVPTLLIEDKIDSKEEFVSQKVDLLG